MLLRIFFSILWLIGTGYIKSYIESSTLTLEPQRAKSLASGSLRKFVGLCFADHREITVEVSHINTFF